MNSSRNSTKCQSSTKPTIRWISSEAAFTPYFALTQHDRSRLSYLAEIDLTDGGDLPAGIPVEARFPELPTSRVD